MTSSIETGALERDILRLETFPSSRYHGDLTTDTARCCSTRTAKSSYLSPEETLSHPDAETMHLRRHTTTSTTRHARPKQSCRAQDETRSRYRVHRLPNLLHGTPNHSRYPVTTTPTNQPSLGHGRQTSTPGTLLPRRRLTTTTALWRPARQPHNRRTRQPK